jgi:hypothetical protein
VNHKRVYRLYRKEGLQVRRRKRKRIGAMEPQPLTIPTRGNERWSMDFVSDALTDGRKFRSPAKRFQSLTVVAMLPVDGAQSGQFPDVLRVEELLAHGPGFLKKFCFQVMGAFQGQLTCFHVAFAQPVGQSESFLSLFLASCRLVQKAQMLLDAKVPRSKFCSFSEPFLGSS